VPEEDLEFLSPTDPGPIDARPHTGPTSRER
jgi:hypothetical protein